VNSFLFVPGSIIAFRPHPPVVSLRSNSTVNTMYYGMAPLATRSAKLLGVYFLVFNDLEADKQS